MSTSITIERDDAQVLAIYIQIFDGDVARTVEIEEGACYVDEDAQGQIVGVELLAPGSAANNLRAVQDRYREQVGIDRLLARALDTVNV